MLLEKNEQPGGRSRQWIRDGFTFYLGPTWYRMPEIFESFFTDFGKNISEFYRLIRLDPSYRVVFGKNDFMDIPAGVENTSALFETYENGSGKNIITWLWSDWSSLPAGNQVTCHFETAQLHT